VSQGKDKAFVVLPESFRTRYPWYWDEGSM